MSTLKPVKEVWVNINDLNWREEIGLREIGFYYRIIVDNNIPYMLITADQINKAKFKRMFGIDILR